MYAVSISLGASSSYVAVAPVNSSTNAAPSDVPPIKVIANSSGHRNTPVVAALMEQEVLFGDNALHQFSRQPQKVVPYLFSFAAAAASIADTQHTTAAADGAEAAEADEDPTSDLLQVVESAVRQKYKGHCRMTMATAGARRLGFEYATEANGEPVESFMPAEDLFIRFLNYVKEHSVDGACGLTTSNSPTGDSPATSTAAKIFLTLVVPRYAFPEAADSAHAAHRSSTVEWLREAVQASHLGAVVSNTSVMFSDEAVVMAYDGAAVERRIPRFLGAATHNMLVVDWGVQSLSLSLLCSRGGVLVCPPRQHNVPYRCFTRSSGAGNDGYFACGGYCGGDALDLALAERVAAQYITQQRRLFSGTVRNFTPLMRLNHSLPSQGSAEHPATQLIQEAIPARAMRRLALLMAEKKVSLNTNPQATSVSVEVEAFYEGMDLVDAQTLSKNKLDNAIRSEWGLVDMFGKAVRAFAERYHDTWTDGFVDAVLFAGGMCQMTSLTKLLATFIQTPEQRSLFSPNVRVLDSSVMGNGVSADELLSVGGCQLSYRVAEAFAANRLAKSRQLRKGAGKLRASLLAQATETASSVWDAFTKEEDDDDEDESSVDAQRAEVGDAAHTGVFLGKNVYLYAGETSALTPATATQRLPRTSLQLLLPRSSPLPSRVVIPWSPASPQATAVLYLFTDAQKAAAAAADEETIEVQPVHSAGVTVSAAAALSGSRPSSTCFIIVTAQAKWNEDSEREAQLSVQLVRAQADGAVPAALTPGNVCSTIEVRLH